MDDKKVMKKNSFISGAFVSTLGIIISKILGIIYVIPFHALIGNIGGALYGYAYTIYQFFIGISTAGIPLSISKITSDFNSKGYYNAKKRAFILGKRLAVTLGFISFLILMIFAPVIAKFIMGNLSGGNSLSDITMVIRIISLAILIVPLLSIYRGYMQGHMIMTPPSISQVIEQIVRVSLIIFGSFIVIKLFKKSITYSVAVALMGAFFGALCSYLYLLNKYKKNKKRFNERINPRNEPIISNTDIIKMIIIYAIPFIMIDVVKTLFDFVDTFTVVKGLVNYANYSTADAESIMSMLSTWGKKFNMIIISINSGIVISLIPSLTESISKKDKDEVNKKINDSFSMLLFFIIPMVIGICILANPIWNLFYNTTDGALLLSYFIFTSIFISLFTMSVTIIQLFKDYKMLIISMVIGLATKMVLNVNMISIFYKSGLPPYYGVITASIIGYFITFLICFITLIFKYKIRMDKFINNGFNILIGSILMTVVLLVIKFIIPINVSSRLLCLLLIILYAIIGMTIYFVYSYKTGLFKDVLGNKFTKILNKNLTK